MLRGQRARGHRPAVHDLERPAALPEEIPGGLARAADHEVVRAAAGARPAPSDLGGDLGLAREHTDLTGVPVDAAPAGGLRRAKLHAVGQAGSGGQVDELAPVGGVAREAGSGQRHREGPARHHRLLVGVAGQVGGGVDPAAVGLGLLPATAHVGLVLRVAAVAVLLAHGRGLVAGVTRGASRATGLRAAHGRLTASDEQHGGGDGGGEGDRKLGHGILHGLFQSPLLGCHPSTLLGNRLYTKFAQNLFPSKVEFY